jgi:hypothetical protein
MHHHVRLLGRTRTQRPDQANAPVVHAVLHGLTLMYCENIIAQGEGEVTIGCIGTDVNDVYAVGAHNSFTCTRRLIGLFQEICNSNCLQ